MSMLLDRFTSKVSPEPNGGCWLWHSTLDGRGYGTLKVDRRQVGAHRVSWEIHHGQIPSGMCVCHKCDVPTCVNPAHLFLGTHAENAADRDAKGRNARGVKHWKAKLSAKEVLEIRESKEKTKVLRLRFGVSRSTIQNIRRGSMWKSL